MLGFLSGLILCILLQPLWVCPCNFPDVPRKHCFFIVFNHFWLLQSFHPLIHSDPRVLGKYHHLTFLRQCHLIKLNLTNSDILISHQIPESRLSPTRNQCWSYDMFQPNSAFTWVLEIQSEVLILYPLYPLSHILSSHSKSFDFHHYFFHYHCNILKRNIRKHN